MSRFFCGRDLLQSPRIDKKPWFLVCCKTSLTGADPLTVSPLGEVPSRRAAEVGSIEPAQARVLDLLSKRGRAPQTFCLLHPAR